MSKRDKIKFIDLFAGIGGIRKGFEIACKSRNIETECVFTSEIKEHAITVLKQNHPEEKVYGDITKVETKDIPDFDILLAGFPCQAFSSAGKRLGFEDTRGTMFFEVERILKDKQPYGFILENVEGLINHDKENLSDKIGRTLNTILSHLDKLGYKITWKLLNAVNFGVPQERKRVYIVGTKEEKPNLKGFEPITKTLSSVLEKGLPVKETSFISCLLRHYTVSELCGKSIKDKRGGLDNIHCWDIESKGHITEEQKKLLNLILTERRKHKWAEEYKIDWMDGMPLTIEMIRTFYNVENLEELLSDLVEKKYLRYEYPKKKVGKKRLPDTTLPMGYNIVTGKMSFEVTSVLDPMGFAPTLVAMDMQHLFVPEEKGIRQLTLREGLKLFGYPKNFKMDIPLELGYDLLGNTVVVPVITAVSNRLLDVMEGKRMEKLTSLEILDRLLKQDQILKQKGLIQFHLGEVNITVKQRDVVGNIMQEWLQGWLDKNNIDYALNDNTQMPPDFFLNPDNMEKNLLEVKAFNRSAAPGFDIADFRMYEEEICEKPYMLDVDYLIFGYDMNEETGIVTIKDVWLKKVWNITSASKDWALKLQVKDKVVHKIRPCSWFSEKAEFKPFASLEHFISAVEEVMYKNPKTHEDAGQWLNTFLSKYDTYYKKKLSIPRWNDIKSSYVPN